MMVPTNEQLKIAGPIVAAVLAAGIGILRAMYGAWLVSGPV
jgi:hypothetical protein